MFYTEDTQLNGAWASDPREFILKSNHVLISSIGQRMFHLILDDNFPVQTS